MNDTRTVIPELSSNLSSIFSPSDYSSASHSLCAPYIRRRRPKTIIHYNDAPPSKILKPGEGVNLEVDFFRTYDDLYIRHARFAPSDENITDTYVPLQGKSTPIECNQDRIEYIVRDGHQAFTMDWRSQGLSSRSDPRTDKVHVEDFLEYARDLRQFLYETVLPQKKGRVVIVADSMGAAVVFTAIVHKLIPQDKIDEFFFPAPLTASKDLTMENISLTGIDGKLDLKKACADLWRVTKGQVALRVADLECRLGRGKKYCWTTGDRNWDFERTRYTDYTLILAELEKVAQQNILEPRIKSGGPTWSWIQAYSRYVKLLDKMEQHCITVPSTLILAGHDNIVFNPKTLRVAHRIMAKYNTHILPAAHAFEMSGAELIRETGDIILGKKDRNPQEDGRGPHRTANPRKPKAYEHLPMAA